MCIVMIVVMIESLGMFLALGEMTGKKVDQRGADPRPAGRWRRHPDRRHLQHLPLHVVLAECRPGRRHRRTSSRWVTIAGGVIMLLLGLLPKMAALVEAVPQVVLGGAGLVMFGMVAATGARILTSGRLQDQPLQPVRGRHLGRLRHDPAGGAELLQAACRTICNRCWSRDPARRRWWLSSSTPSSMASAAVKARGRTPGVRRGRGACVRR